jgi:hypothetical protein
MASQNQRDCAPHGISATHLRSSSMKTLLTASRHVRLPAATVLWLTFCAPKLVAAQVTAPTNEIRQIVTFLFQPGRLQEAVTIYEQQLKPIYSEVSELSRFRAYRESESPEPLDLVVVSSYKGMAGMDAANQALRRRTASGTSAFALYGTLSTMTQHHHDQFIELLPALSDTAATDGDLTVFEYIRVVPGAQRQYTRMLERSIRPFERRQHLYAWSETARTLVSDGWDFVRIYGLRSLGDWHRFQQQSRDGASGAAYDRLIVARKTLILRRDNRLSVR